MCTKMNLAVGILIGGLIANVGCGRGDQPELGAVQGAVTLDSQPLAGATIVFQPGQGKVSRGLTNAEGRYELTYLREIKGARPGLYKVSITTATEHAPQERVLARYNSQTTLSEEVHLGSNELDFELTSHPSEKTTH